MSYMLYSRNLVCIVFILFSTVKGKDVEECFSPVLCSGDKHSETSWRQVFPTVNECENSTSASLDSLRKDFEDKFEKMTITIEELSKKVATADDESKGLNRTIIQVGDEARQNFLYIPKENYCYMGMKDFSIPNSAITASSETDYKHAAYLARLDNTFVMTTQFLFNNGAWNPAGRAAGEWIQVDLGVPKSVGGVITQGRTIPPTSHLQWVTSFTVAYGNDTSEGSLTTLPAESSGLGQSQIFDANRDSDGKVVNMFSQPIVCRYIRLMPQTWNRHVSLRLELIRGECHTLYPPGRSTLPRNNFDFEPM